MIKYVGQLKEYNYMKNSHVKRKHRKNAKIEKYCDDIFTFDLESTSAWINEHGNIIRYKKGYSSEYWNNLDPVSLCYIWQFSVNDTVYYGRSIEEFRQLIDDIPKDIHMIIWVHNLSFEAHFLMNIFDDLSMFCRQSHKPIYLYSESHKNIEFRCSYMLTQLSLATWGEQLGCKKLVGDLDYEKIRTPLTTLTLKEMAYCRRDCEVVYKGIQDYLKRYDTQWDIPLTQTGTVRREVKNLLTSDSQYVKAMKQLVPRDAAEYGRLRKTFAGGYTHANRAKAGIVQTGGIDGIIEHYDFVSSYPCELVKQKYPCAPWVYTGKHEMPTDEDFKKFGYLMLLYFEAIECITFNTYIQSSKCSGSGFKYDNGRIISAEHLEIWVTEQDYLTIRDTYRWNKIEVKRLYYSYKRYLPTPFIKYLLELYGNKTTLKGSEEGTADYDLYMQSKQYINSLFGMAVTALVQADVHFNNSSREFTTDILTDKKVQEHLDKLRSWNPREKRYFLNYSWGVWCTAYARRDLWRCILGENGENDIDVIYADTDSIFINGRHDFTWYNKETVAALDTAMDYHKLPRDLTRPLDKEGKPQQLGIFDKEKDIAEFITLGAKRYVERRAGDKKLHLTVSGINKEAVYILNDNIENFCDGLNFDKDFPTIRKRLPTYINNQPPLIWPDGYKSTCKSGVNLRRNGYKLTVTDEYKALIKYATISKSDLPQEFINHLRGRWIKEPDIDVPITYKDSWGNYITITKKEQLQIEIAQYLIDNPSLSIKKIATEFMLSDTTIRRYLKNVQYIDDDLYMQCKNILKRRKRA